MFRLTRWALAAVPAVTIATGATALLAQQPPQGGASQPAADPVARGRYIVEDVATCWRCHSPVDSHGERDHTHWLLGGQVGTRPTVPSGDWAIVAPRIAGAPPGTDEQFVTLLMTGIARTGHAPRQPMPQFRMTRADAEAVLAYLKSLGSHPARPAAAPPPAAPALTRK
jgi:mono/diheme cytochrome c family protein